MAAASSGRSLAGNTIWLRCEYSVRLPLWDTDGPLEDDPQWVSAKLKLSQGLIADLVAWAQRPTLGRLLTRLRPAAR